MGRIPPIFVPYGNIKAGHKYSIQRIAGSIFNSQLRLHRVRCNPHQWDKSIRGKEKPYEHIAQR